MITKLNYYRSHHTVPYWNLGVETFLLNTVPKDTCTLYLWQNQRTVVVGKNQNCWAECRVNNLEEDGGYLVRRLSGGGAVYHDKQNINFTFLLNEEDYDVERQLEVILLAVRSFGLDARKNGRNDITIDGRKFSGNAFYKSEGKCYHHGTLLVDVDTFAMNRYLNVSTDKLESKGVASVKSRVVNLKELCPDITITALCEALVDAFSQVYGSYPKTLTESDIDYTKVKELEGEFESWDWNFGRNVAFSWQAQRRFAWGGVNIQVLVEKGRVVDAIIYSDAMEGEFIASLPTLLIGKTFDISSLMQALETTTTPDEENIITDLRQLIKEELL
ncbi:MAG: lipoate--protein ligase [Eubacteriaceae bacterium]